MGEMEKPFTCPEQNCHMSFTNEDHLQVHQRCHEAQLTINQGSLQPTPSFFKHHGFLIDQTPTPSRFLKHGEEISLFQDINLNPFDIEFHKASLNRSYRSQLSVPENHGGGGSLETPRILPRVDSDETISSTSRDDPQVPVSSALPPLAIHSTTTSGSVVAGAPSPPQLNTPSVMEGDQEPEKREGGRKKLTLNVSTASEVGQSNIISTPTPVITAGPSVSQSLGAPSCSTPTLNTPNILTASIPHITLNGVGLGLSDLNTPGLSPTLRLTVSPPCIDASLESHLAMSSDPHREPRVLPKTCNSSSSSSTPPTAVHVPTSPLSFHSEGTSSVPPSPSATVLQLLLRLPNGQSIPVEIPATPVVTTSNPISKTTTSVVTCIAPAAPAYQTTAFTSVITNPTPSLAKLKLKQALASSNTAARPGVTKHSRATTADRIAEMTRNRNSSGASSNGGDAQEESSNSSCSSGASISISMSNNTSNGNTSSGGRRRRNSVPDDNPEEKRRKFLERNRVAAVRCREKKKRFVETMRMRSDELGYQNQRLQNEVGSLRAEVASLKSLLLLHKDCPVTLAMQGEEDNHESKFQTELPAAVGVPAAGGGHHLIAANAVAARPILPQPVAFVPIKRSPSPKLIPVVTVGQPAPSLPELSSADLTSKLRKRSLSLSSIPLSQAPPLSVGDKSHVILASDAVVKPAYVCSFPKSTASGIYIPSVDLTRCQPTDTSSSYPSLTGVPAPQKIAPALGMSILPSFESYKPEGSHLKAIAVNNAAITTSSPVVIHAPPPPSSSSGQSARQLPAVRGNALLIKEPKAILPKEPLPAVQIPVTTSHPSPSVIIDNAFCIHSKIVINQRPSEGVPSTVPQR